MEENVIRGKLLELICRELLEDAGYTILTKKTNKVVVSKSGNKIELYGRGTKHEIDLPYEFKYHVPFVSPIQVLGEVKYYEKPIEKKTIREFIGVLNDIKDNNVLSHLKTLKDLEDTRLTQGLFILANGFQIESEKLAYAYNIKLITFKGNPILEKILKSIDIEAKRLSKLKRPSAGLNKAKEKIYKIFKLITKSYFLATTSTGYLMYFVSKEEFDFTNANKTLSANYNQERSINELTKDIRLEINGNTFVSTLPDKIYEEFTKEHLSKKSISNSKFHHFSPLTVYKKDNEGGIKVFQIHFS